MIDEPAALGDCGVGVIGEGRSADVMRDGDDAGGQMASMADEKLTVASEDDGVNGGFGKAVRGRSGADVGRPSAGMVDDRVGGELAVGIGLVEDAADTARRARKAVDGEGDARRAGGGGGGGADSADVVESGVDVGRLGLSKMVAWNRPGATYRAWVQGRYGLVGMMLRADRDVALGQSAASWAPSPESRANVAAQHLCRPSGTDRSTDDGGCMGSMESKRQSDEAVDGGSGGTGAASCFPGTHPGLYFYGMILDFGYKNSLVKKITPELKFLMYPQFL